MEGSGKTEEQKFVPMEPMIQINPFPLKIRQSPASSCDFSSIESRYTKMYKVGQGSYGFELI